MKKKLFSLEQKTKTVSVDVDALFYNLKKYNKSDVLNSGEKSIN